MKTPKDERKAIDNKTDKEEKENFVESVMMELDNSNTILIGKEKK